MYSTFAAPSARKARKSGHTPAAFERAKSEIVEDLALAAFASLRGDTAPFLLHKAAAEKMIERGLNDPKEHMGIYVEVLNRLASLARLDIREI